jgi:hypothetical protein
MPMIVAIISLLNLMRTLLFMSTNFYLILELNAFLSPIYIFLNFYSSIFKIIFLISIKKLTMMFREHHLVGQYIIYAGIRSSNSGHLTYPP